MQGLERGRKHLVGVRLSRCVAGSVPGEFGPSPERVVEILGQVSSCPKRTRQHNGISSKIISFLWCSGLNVFVSPQIQMLKPPKVLGMVRALGR